MVMRKIGGPRVKSAHFLTVMALALVPFGLSGSAFGDNAHFLDTLGKQKVLASTVPDNGDVNPYAVVVAPVSIGKIKAGDVLITNFNDKNNLQGVGTTIVNYNPAANAITLFASVPHKLADCPGGVGLTTAMTVLKSGYVIVGSLPSDDGTMKTGGQGCLLVFDADGKFIKTLASQKINGPWGNMAVVDKGDGATLFVSNIGAGSHPSADPTRQADVIRLELTIKKEGPIVKDQTVIADGFTQRPDKDVFVIGPTGLVLDQHGTLYVSDAIGNGINAIPDALTRKGSAGTGTLITKDGMLRRPLAMTLAPNGNLLAVNGLNGQVIEIDPLARKQVASRWINSNKAQTPPGSGDLFGLALTPDGKGFYFVNDDVNQLAVAH